MDNAQDAATPPLLAPTKDTAVSVINQADNLGRTPLHALTCSGNLTDEQQRIELMKKLVALGASTNAQDHKGFTPLHFSVIYKRPTAFIGALHTLGADMRLGNSEHKTPLFVACENGCIEQIEALLSHIPALQPQAPTPAPATPIAPAETAPANN
jgi:ankyrin repeat protein